MLDIDIARKTYPDRGGRPHLALRELRMQVRPGEFACVVGPSGCGKSTLLNLVGGLDADYEGRIALDGRQPGSGIGFMFQESRLMPWLTVLENVELVLRGDPRGRGGRANCCGRWNSAKCSMPILAGCRAACSGAWRWHAPSSSSRACC